MHVYFRPIDSMFDKATHTHTKSIQLIGMIGIKYQHDWNIDDWTFLDKLADDICKKGSGINVGGPTFYAN